MLGLKQVREMGFCRKLSQVAAIGLLNKMLPFL